MNRKATTCSGDSAEPGYLFEDIPQQTSVRRGVIDAHHHLGQEWGAEEQFREIAHMYGIRHFIVLPYNQKMHEQGLCAMDRFPDLFTGLGYLNPDVHGPDRIGLIRESGCAGIKVYHNSDPYDTPEYMKLWEKAAEWGMPVMFHTTGASHCRPSSMRRILEAFPGWKLQCAHFGSDAWREAAQIWTKFPQLYYDFSGSIVSRRPYEEFAQAMGGNPPWERMVFGTDKWWYRVAAYIRIYKDMLDYFNVPEKTRQKIFTQNAIDLYSLKNIVPADGEEPAGSSTSAVLTLKRLSIPRTVTPGKPFDMSMEIIPEKKIQNLYLAQVHIYRSGYPTMTADPRGLNFETFFRNSGMWEPGKAVCLDTFSPTLLEESPEGEYVIKLILRGTVTEPDGSEKNICCGFTNPEIDDSGIIARFRVKK